MGLQLELSLVNKEMVSLALMIKFMLSVSIASCFPAICTQSDFFNDSKEDVASLRDSQSLFRTKPSSPNP